MTGNDEVHQAASTGLSGTRAGWLDTHFEALRPEYEQAVRDAGFEQGWHVLDAGCGSGSFIPLLAEAVGEGGMVTALDLAPENIEHVQQHLIKWDLPCPVETHTGSLEEMPFEDDTFDGVWLANVLMYFDRATLPAVLSELSRVVRPGGLIAAKESDARSLPFHPMPADVDYYAPLLAINIPGIYDARSLPYRFRDAGLVDITHRTMMIERQAPLTDVEHAYIGELLRGGAHLAQRIGVSGDAGAFWEQQVDPNSPDALVNHPEFAFAVGHIIVTGRVPPGW